ncbi:hypothetical protein NW768_001763 [Fusarium equiseti]|uniref:Uncharacterized protein n=1 Tax=Fusarium equiseti TaxID=61235 RepID=A0ABQ8RR25_FUSEQ|nr:hypothetical protein NW768_001763 [Fusarium equiseti]
MNPIFKAVSWCEDDNQQQKNDQPSSFDVLGQDKVTRWMRDGIQVLYCDRLPDISSIARPIEKCGSYMDMLQLWTSDLDFSTNTRETSSEFQVKHTTSLEEQQAKDIEREEAFHDSLAKAGGRPWYSRTLIAHVARNPGNYDELLQYWKKDPTGSEKGQWMVFERQLERWNLFCRYQRRARRNSDTFKEYSARCNRRLSNQLSSAALDMKQDPNDQDSLSQWLEYLCFELSECKRYSWYKRYHQHYENAWQILVDSKALRSHESRSRVETIEYASLHNDERTSLRQAVEAASSEVLLAERDSLNPSLRGPLAQRKLFEAQANLDSAIGAFDRLHHRIDAIKKYREATSTYREARQGSHRHQILLRWVQQQIPLIEKELGLSCSTQRLTLDGDMLTATESDESDGQGDSIDSSCTSSVCEPGGLQRSESKKRCHLESISGEVTQSSNNTNARPKRSRHSVDSDSE